MKIIERLYEDYLKKNRLENYKKVLQTARVYDYKMMGILDFFNYANEGLIDSNTRILINRHDIDTSPKVAADFFEIEKEVFGTQGSATYYFRDCTINNKLIYELEQAGYESGYHYETIAKYEKNKKYRSKSILIDHLEEISRLFVKELEMYRQKTNSKSITVASHGDFINVLLDLPNYTLMQIKDIENKNNIQVEAYDEKLMLHVNERFADHMLGTKFVESTIAAIEKKIPVIMILTHPRNWKVDIIENTKANIVRIVEGIKYRK